MVQDLTPDLAALLKAKFFAGASGCRARLEVDHADLDTGEITTTSYRADRLDVDKGLDMDADQAQIHIPRPTVAPLGWGADSVFQRGTRFRLFQWYGAPANAVQTFCGLIDLSNDERNPIAVTLIGRDLMALCIDYTFSTFASQTVGETGAVRTPANGVFLNMELSDIVGLILDAVGWPAADRVIVPSSYVVDEFIWEDGASAFEAIAGNDRLTGLAGYVAFADELGNFHFEPSLATNSLTDPPVPAYIFHANEDILSLADAVDIYDLKTRVKARGELTTQTLTDEWSELWRTSKINKPVGIWFDPTASGFIFVVDRGTKRIYKLRQSDRVIVSSWDISAIAPHPLGLSGDPADEDYYWILNAPWIDGGSGGNRVKRVRKSDNHVVLALDLPDGQISALKVSANYLYYTRLDTDRVYKRDKTDGSAVSSFQHTYNGALQSNPSGLMIDGTTISVFWANGGTTARFLNCSESAPGAVTSVTKTVGTNLHGGEMDTVTHKACYGDSDSLGLVAKFSLVAVGERTDQIFAEVVDTELEDELGIKAQVQPRVHDTHPADAAHPWLARRETIDLAKPAVSLAQVTDTAMRRLDILSAEREILDAGIPGNPAIQKTDPVGVVDPVSGLNKVYTISAYRSTMDATGAYVGVIAGVPIPDLTAENGTIDEDPPADEDPGAGGSFPSIVQHAELKGSASITVHLPSPAGTGDELVAWAITRSSEAVTPTGFTEYAGSPQGAISAVAHVPNAGYVHAWHMTAVGGEQDIVITLVSASGPLAGGVFELADAPIADIVTHDSTTAASHMVLPALTVAAGAQVAIGLFMQTQPAGMSYSPTAPDGAAVEVFDHIVGPTDGYPSNGPRAAVQSLTDGSGPASLALGVTSGLSLPWAAIGLIFGDGGGAGSGSTDDPPPLGGTLQDAIDAASPGDTIDATGQTFHEEITVDVDDLTIIGATLDADGTRDAWAHVTAARVTFDNVHGVNCAAGADQSGGFDISGPDFTAQTSDGDTGPYAIWRLWSGAVRAKLLRCTGTNGPTLGVIGWECDDALIDGGRYHGQTAYNSGLDEGGGIKIGSADRVTIQNVEADNNVGKGIWGDVFQTGWVISNNDVHDNTHDGILYEVCTDGLIELNTVYRNGSTQSDAYSGATGIRVSSSSNTRVERNTVAFNEAAEIAFVSQDFDAGRLHYAPHAGNSATDNVVRDAAATDIGYFTDWGNTAGTPTISGNTLVGDSDPRIASLA